MNNPDQDQPGAGDNSAAEVAAMRCTLREMEKRNEELRAENRRIKHHLREEFEEQLKRMSKLADMGSLAVGVAHDYNNYLSVMLGYLDLIISSRDLPPEVRERLQKVRDNAEQAADLSRNLLGMVRGDDDARALLGLTEIVETVFSLFAFELKRSDIKLEKRLAHPQPVVAAGCGELERVLLNLAINARHAMLHSEKRILRVETGMEGKYAYLRLSDTGRGIAESELAKIFMAYYTTKGRHAEPGSELAKVNGSGLGLSNCKSIVEGLGGYIDVKSAPGAGATFTVFIPAVKQEPDACLRLMQHCQQAGAPAQVLLIEDDPATRDIFEKVLLREGLRVILAADGQEALETLRSGNRVDLVITDMMMPRMDGRAFLQVIRGDMNLGQLPVIMISAVTDAGQVEDLLGLGLTEFIRKPVDMGRFMERVRALLRAR